MRAESIKLIHRGEFLSYYEIVYSDGNGNSKTYEIVSKAGSTKSGKGDLTLANLGRSIGGVVLIVFNHDKSKILLCKEFRLGINGYVYSCPAGMIDAGETPLEAGKRELREETGLELTKVIDILEPSFTSAPMTDDRAVTIICEAQGEITGSDSIYEEIHSKWYTKSKVRELLNNPDIKFSGRMQTLCYFWAQR